ncbi:hypothetical protein C8Q70DRAFT_1051850 [Cubamyces menziesii]|uniref:Uncharacterized protein n=1 Tax=Trametes cubensis TaxID=1111947 RepID=A0AAD7TP86_9APHY|nr:hypothetical protein C8Q70DRAFT_1051850 [Cubamyces menziesii]KAJ8469035.1 hypothetical protein ONZ51_g9246 [Trametes cubensis]
MHLDSSPTPRAVESDRAEFWPNLHKDRWLSDATLCEPYKPTRMPFYSSRPSSVLLESPVDRQLSTPKPTGSFSGHTPDSPCSPAFRHSRDSFCSSISQPSKFGANSSLPPSDSSRFSWSGSTSYLVESDEIPQASFSLSPPVQVALQDFAIGTSPGPESNHTALAHPLIDVPPGDSSEHWQQVSLTELLGGALFENANPWNALDEVLHLSSLGSQQDDVSDLLALVETCDTSTVGHDHPSHCYSQASGSPQVDSIYTQPDFTLEKVTSGGLVDERSVEGDARLASTDRVPLERARDSCNSGAANALDHHSGRPSNCEQSDGPLVEVSSPGSDPSAYPTPLDAPKELRGDDNSPTRMVMSRQGIPLPHDNVDAYDAHLQASGQKDDDREEAVRGGRVLVDGPSLFSDFSDFESEED